MNVLDLFCGAGGLSYGFEKAGFTISLGVDNDKMAIETFLKNHSNTKAICGDITTLSSKDIFNTIENSTIDVIIGGPPCQGFSLSGPRNFDDPRNKLYLSYIRLVKEIQPKAFVIENVPGLAALFNGKIKENIIFRLSELGYKVYCKILCANDYGVPQKRKRIIFVGIKNGLCDFSFPDPVGKTVTCSMALEDLPPLENELGTEIQNYLGKASNDYQELMRRNSTHVYNHIAAKHSDKVKQIIALVPPGKNYKSLPEELRNTRNFHVAWTRFPDDAPSPTIDTGHRHHFHYKYNRVPTVRECARLQSFPDDFIFLGNKTQQFRQVGNAVPPLMAYELAKKLLEVLK